MVQRQVGLVSEFSAQGSHRLRASRYISWGHSGIFRTFKRLVANFHWMGMKRDVQHYIQRCDVCQRNKHDTMTLTSLLQLLPISDWVWEDVSMDFIEGFPTSSGFFVIFVVVDRLSKYGHFIALKHPYSAKMVEIGRASCRERV